MSAANQTSAWPFPLMINIPPPESAVRLFTGMKRYHRSTMSVYFPATFKTTAEDVTLFQSSIKIWVEKYHAAHPLSALFPSHLSHAS
jgi:hypothetical protein